MGKYIFRLPDIGEGIAEAEIVAWHVKVGDRVEEDGPLADMMTDKATVEMESPVSGVVREVAGEVGDTVPIGSPLVVIETEDAAEFEAPDPASAQVRVRIEAETPEARGNEHATALENRRMPAPVRTSAGEWRLAQSSGEKVLASPAVRARAQRLGIDLAHVPAGPGGVIRHARSICSKARANRSR
jgi:2-oxoisovalerate dehydrogenase E2 component (dihydrolipoyl transacylase)